MGGDFHIGSDLTRLRDTIISRHRVRVVRVGHAESRVSIYCTGLGQSGGIPEYGSFRAGRGTEKNAMLRHI